jgi:peptide/nickel transport system substrate-binding protein
MQVNLWVLDGFTEPCLVAGRANFLRAWWWAPQWYTWWNTGGKSGEEPPADIKKLFDLCDQIPTLPPAQMRNVMKQILRRQAEELWMVGTVGFIGKPAIAKVNLGNINTKAPGDSHDVGGSRMIWAEQVFWKK